MNQLKNPDQLDRSYAETMKIWIGRFKESQAVVRELEGVLNQVHAIAHTEQDTEKALLMIKTLIAAALTEEEDAHEGHSHG